MNYCESVIQIAPDSTATRGCTPSVKGETKSIPAIEYELLSRRPYFYTQEELQFAVYLEPTYEGLNLPPDDATVVVPLWHGLRTLDSAGASMTGAADVERVLWTAAISLVELKFWRRR